MVHFARLARFGAALAAVALAATGCADDGTTDIATSPTPTIPELALEEVVTGLDVPVSLATAPGDDRLFVLERYAGTIRIVDDGVLVDEPFLDLHDRLVANGEDPPSEIFERGLLGLAFHPDYATNGRFFVYYADLTGRPELVEYRVSADPDHADPDSAVVLRQFEQSPLHYGGTLLFGPDHALWLSIGDGEEASAAADRADVRGSLLRFDVSIPGQAVAADGNPFLGDHPGADEVWASGLRNPWRFSIDAETGLLYVGDVGYITAEEVSVVPLAEPGADFGWPRFEATKCSDPSDCDPAGTVVPVVRLVRSVDACAVIGGVVYRGTAIPELQGAYLYSDFCYDWLRTFRYEGGEAAGDQELLDEVGKITSIGTDADGEVLLVEQTTGTVLRLVPTG